MKNISSIIFIALVLSFLSCNKDPNGNANTLNDLQLNQIKNFVPYEVLIENSKAIFVNAEGKTRVLEIKKNSFQIDKVLEGKSYKTQQEEFEYSDPDESNYKIKVSLTASYKEMGLVQELLNASLNTTLNNGYIALVTIMDDGLQSLGVFSEEKILNGKSFNKVYSSWSIEGQGFVYNGLHYTKEQGVVGFLDAENELWSLDRFEK